MHRQFVEASTFESVDPGIFPDVGAVASVLAEFEGVDVRPVAVLENKNEFVLGTVECSHAGIVLGPHDQVLCGQALLAACARQLEKMPPVHEHEQDGTVPGIGFRVAEKRGQESGELGF